MYICDSCGHSSKNFFGLCPSCKSGSGELISGDTSNNTKTRSSIKKDAQIHSYKIEKASGDFKEEEIVMKTGFGELDKVISKKGGFVKDQVIIIGAQPGTGKSTLLAQIANEGSLYITSEESANQVKSRFNRVNPGSKASVVAETDIDTILYIIENTSDKLIIIDSLNAVNNGADGYLKQASNAVKITSTLKRLGKIGVIISQVSKSGEITGMNTIMHAVDTVVYMDKSELQDSVVVGSTKNRFGAVGSVAIFRHEENGLVESFNLREDQIEDMTGITLTSAKFGYKNIDVTIEALVAPSSMNFGLRRANGVNANRVQQIIGVLANNSKIDFSTKDIYVSVANGLNVTDPSADLAIANSILSSYYGRKSKFTKLSGIISLNGTVSRSDSVKHISELLQTFYC